MSWLTTRRCDSYYRLAKTVEDDPEFDTRKAQKKLRRFVEGHDYAIDLKAEIMVDHFHSQVLAQQKVGGQARAMVVTNGVQRAIQYYHYIKDRLEQRGSPYRAIVAFSGEHDWGGARVTEASLNEFPSTKIAERIQRGPLPLAWCAPTSSKPGTTSRCCTPCTWTRRLFGVKAVQTLSRLNRSHPRKHDVFVLDFLNGTETIREAFDPYYRTTVLADETDPNKLHDLVNDLAQAQVYSTDQVGTVGGVLLGRG